MPVHLSRRDFLAASGILALASSRVGAAKTDSPLDDHRINRVRGFRYRAPRPKFVGKNSHLDNHGDHTSDEVLVLTTDRGVEGVGAGRIGADAARAILGKPVSALWSDDRGSIGALGRADHALFDLVGKILEKPAWTLLGGKGDEWTRVYDGSIYFNDILDEHAARGVDRLLDEVDMGLEAGFRAFKIKVGRGYKWMEKDAGFRRDVEVIRRIREHVGPDVDMMVDANNGFTPEETRRWLGEVGDCRLTFVEEMFPEAVEDDRNLREFLRERDWGTLVADGESADKPEHFTPYLDAGVLDILQPDIRAFGLSLQWTLAKELKRRSSPARLAPHNWGSHLGGFMQVTLARGLEEVVWCEIDRSRSTLFDSSAYPMRDGRMRAPDVAGCGLVLKAQPTGDDVVSDAWEVSS